VQRSVIKLLYFFLHISSRHISSHLVMR